MLAADYEIQGSIIRIENVTVDKGPIGSNGIIIDSAVNGRVVLLDVNQLALEACKGF